MQRWLIGFEGGAEAVVSVSYGAAAFADEQLVYNAVTEASCSLPQWEECLAAHIVTRVQPYGPFDRDIYGQPCYVFRAKANRPVAATVKAQLRPEDGVLREWESEGWFFLLFPSFEALSVWARRMAPLLLKFGAGWPDPYGAEMRKGAELLDATEEDE